MAVRRALISVFDKTGLDRFATGLAELGVELVASGGTAAYISELGLSVKPVDALTDVPEMLGGRVKTLHPRIHGAILARRDVKADMEALEEHGIEPFDLVCVNLYPFAQVASRKDVREEEAVEMIDIGGPAMLRAAAKNFEHVAPVSGKELSFNNLGDLDAARGVLGEFELPTCVVVKHGNPCGVGVASALDDAAAKAYAADPVSAYGGVVAVNRRVDPPLAKRLA